MKKTGKPIIAGILEIVTGIVRLSGGIVALIFGSLGDGIMNVLWMGMPGIEFVPYRFLVIVAVPVMVLGILAIAGGVLALQRKGWGWAFTGAIVADLFSWILGLPALVLIALSRDEFQR